MSRRAMSLFLEKASGGSQMKTGEAVFQTVGRIMQNRLSRGDVSAALNEEKVSQSICEKCRARPKRCFAGCRASFCFSFGQGVAGKQAEQNEKHNENETKNTVEVEP